MFSPELITDAIVGFPVTVAVALAPIILMFLSHTTMAQESSPEIPITKRQFITRLYLKIFLSTFIAVPVVVLVWFIAALTGHVNVDYILSTGLYSLGVGFLFVWIVMACFYTLQFTLRPLMHFIMLDVMNMPDYKEEKSAGYWIYKSLLISVIITLAWWCARTIQSLLFRLELQSILTTLLTVLIGLVILLIGWVVALKLYERN